MIKRLIFDVDGTLIDWKDEYDSIVLEKCLSEFNIEINNDLIEKIKKAFIEYENIYEFYSKNLFMNNINKYTNLKLSEDFLNYYFKYSIKYATPNCLPEENIKTLEFLHSKYELVALTNWFAEPQIERLKKVDILKYFSDVFSAEKTRMKPHSDSFLVAAGNTDLNECCMIGDSFNSDISGALALGISCVYITSKPVKLPNCICIKKFTDLKNVFDC